MKRFRIPIALACLVGFVAGRASLANTPPPPPDFGSEADWHGNNIFLVRVVGVRDGTVTLRMERSYTGREDTADTTIALSAISFGYEWKPGSFYPSPKPVSVKEGDELVVWPGRWQPGGHASYLPGEKIAGTADKNPLVQSLEQISKIRDAGGLSEGFETGAERERIIKLRATGGEDALKRGASSKDSTVVRYSLSVLGTFPKKSDKAFAERLRALRADTSRPVVLRLSANQLLPRYTAAAEQADVDAEGWVRSTFSAGTFVERGRHRLSCKGGPLRVFQKGRPNRLFRSDRYRRNYATLGTLCRDSDLAWRLLRL